MEGIKEVYIFSLCCVLKKINAENEWKRKKKMSVVEKEGKKEEQKREK